MEAKDSMRGMRIGESRIPAPRVEGPDRQPPPWDLEMPANPSPLGEDHREGEGGGAETLGGEGGGEDV